MIRAQMWQSLGFECECDYGQSTSVFFSYFRLLQMARRYQRASSGGGDGGPIKTHF
jgi:hypothetical protein